MASIAFLSVLFSFFICSALTVSAADRHTHDAYHIGAFARMVADLACMTEELECGYAREIRHCGCGADRRLLERLKEFDRRVGHLEKTVRGHMNRSTIARRARYAHETADKAKDALRGAHISRNLVGLFKRAHDLSAALENCLR